ncbi:MAG: hypothetical protein UHD09_04525 [Bifidobacterium sp.]|nr:hypothetical protein [Bifidobacterium sp.]
MGVHPRPRTHGITSTNLLAATLIICVLLCVLTFLSGWRSTDPNGAPAPSESITTTSVLPSSSRTRPSTRMEPYTHRESAAAPRTGTAIVRVIGHGGHAFPRTQSIREMETPWQQKT